MARATLVKKARKDIPGAGIKAGDSYYWWKFRYGGKHYSKTAPKQSQLTQSAFWSAVYDLQEREQPDYESLSDAIDDIKGELENLRDEAQSSLDNMPEGLQQGSTGELLQNRADNVESAIGELESIEVTDDDALREELSDELDEGEWDKLTDEERQERLKEKQDELGNEIWGQVTDALGNISD